MNDLIPIASAVELGQLLRSYRVNHHMTLEKVAGMTGVGMRFLSELERGKETAQIGKVLYIIRELGLEIFLQPRGAIPRKTNQISKIVTRRKDNA